MTVRSGALVMLVVSVMTLGGCASSRDAITGTAGAVVRAGAKTGEGSALTVTRRLYLSERYEATWIQKGYPIDVSRLDKFSSRCQFVMNFKGLSSESIDSSKIEPDTFAVTHRWDEKSTVQAPSEIQVASNNLAQALHLAQAVAILDWTTTLRLDSKKHPWVRELVCIAANNLDRNLSAEEIGAVISPSLKLVLKP